MLTLPTKAAVVTPNDTTDLAIPGTLFIGTGGDLKCTLKDMDDGTFLTFYNIPDGSEFPRVVKRVHTDTTCSNIIVDTQ